MRKVVLTEYLHATMLFTGPFFHKRIPNKLHISYACSIIYEMTNFMAASEYRKTSINVRGNYYFFSFFPAGIIRGRTLHNGK